MGLLLGDGVVSLATNQKIQAGDLTTWVEGQEKKLEWEGSLRFSNLWRTKLSPGSLFEAALTHEGPRFVHILRLQNDKLNRNSISSLSGWV